MMEPRWSKYFMSVCDVVASNSSCHSHQIGAILVRDKIVVATGYNGPARGVPHCGGDRLDLDHNLRSELLGTDSTGPISEGTCPRQLLGYSSGQGLEWCIAAHAEQNTIANAARVGVMTFGTHLWMNDVIPCKNCLINLINAGVNVIFVKELILYDETSRYIIKHSNLHIRDFEGEVYEA